MLSPGFGTRDTGAKGRRVTVPASGETFHLLFWESKSKEELDVTNIAIS